MAEAKADSAGGQGFTDSAALQFHLSLGRTVLPESRTKAASPPFPAQYPFIAGTGALHMLSVTLYSHKNIDFFSLASIAVETEFQVSGPGCVMAKKAL